MKVENYQCDVCKKWLNNVAEVVSLSFGGVHWDVCPICSYSINQAIVSAIEEIKNNKPQK